MFNKLKEKLKSALNIFSKKTEEELKPAMVKEEAAPAEPPIHPYPVLTEEESALRTQYAEKLEKEEKQRIETQKIDDAKKAVTEKKGVFERIKEFVTTKKISEEKFHELFAEMEQAMLENNVAVEVIEKIRDALKEALVEKPLARDVETVINDTLKQTIRQLLTKDSITLTEKPKQKEKKPLVIAFFGINGSGKTTTIAKVAHLFQKSGHTIVLAAGDTFRAAAIQQLEEWADKLNVRLIKHSYGADAAAVAFDAVRYAEKNNVDVVLVDTAGRLHSDTNLMDELKKICRVVHPDLKIFVGESIVGNDCVEQARNFGEHIGIDAIILTKADIDEKGGAALSISYITQKPILYLGIGQELDDLEEFSVEKVMERLGLE